MKATSALLALATCSSALSIWNPQQAMLGDQSEDSQYLIETAPDSRRWISEDEKWVLRRVNGDLCYDQVEN